MKPRGGGGCHWGPASDRGRASGSNVDSCISQLATVETFESCKNI